MTTFYGLVMIRRDENDHACEPVGGVNPARGGTIHEGK